MLVQIVCELRKVPLKSTFDMINHLFLHIASRSIMSWSLKWSDSVLTQTRTSSTQIFTELTSQFMVQHSHLAVVLDSRQCKDE